MIPEVARVVQAAKVFAHSLADDTDSLRELHEAVDALEMRETRPAGQPTYEEEDRTWGEVVTGDEILSAKTGRWYEVTRSVNDDTAGKARVNIKGSPRPIIRDLGDSVRVKRGKLGDSLDLFQVLWSGSNRPETVGTQGIGPMMGVGEEEDDDERE